MSEKMKKRFLLLFSAFILVLAVFLGGCLGGNKGGGGNTVPDPGKDPETPAEEVFFDYSALNYNPEYSNPSDPNEKGFIIYDNIDFTLVTFRVATPMSPYFIISQGNKVFATIKKPDTLPSYPPFSPDKPGEYTVEVIAPKAGKNSRDLAGRFTIKVSAGGFPTEIAFDFINFDTGEKEDPRAGEQYTIIPKAFAEGRATALSGERYSGSWQAVFMFPNALDSSQAQTLWDTNHPLTGDLTVTIPNLILDGKLRASYRITVEGRTQPILFQSDIPVENNYAGLSFSFDNLESKNLSIPYSTNFFQRLQARHTFDNGQSEPVTPVPYSDSKKGDTVLFIKYTGQQSFAGYNFSASDFNDPERYGLFGNTARVYVQNGAYYYFSPYYSGAEFYFAYCYREDFGGGAYTKYLRLDGGDFSADFIKEVPDGISITSASGREMKPNTTTNKDEFRSFTRNVVNDTLEIMVTVKKLQFVTYTLDNQYFSLDTQITGSASALKDYYIEYDGSKMGYNKPANKFYSEYDGELQIKFASPHDENISYILTVNFQNPVLKKELAYDDNGKPNLFIKNFRPEEAYLVKDIHYNRKTLTRAFGENESIGIKYGDIIYHNPDLLFTGPGRYENHYTLYLFDNGEKMDVPGVTSGVIYIVPDYIIEVDGVDYLMSDSENYISQPSAFSEYGYNFRGYIPFFKIDVEDIDNSVIKIKNSDGNEVASGVAHIYKRADGIFIAYDGFDIKNALICKIILK